MSWLAGLLEGEGSFMVYWAKARDGSRRPYPRVQMVMNDRDVVERAATLMGGNKVHRHPRKDGYDDGWIIKVTGAKALEVMGRVRPYMGRRRGAKIDELLAQFTKEVMPDAD